MAATSVISGLSSGLDWRKIVDQMRQLEHKRIDRVETRKKGYGEKLNAWQGINSKLLALKKAATTLNQTSHFNLYWTSLSSSATTKAEDVLSVAASTEASPGTYQIVVKQLASAQKLSSTGYARQTATLGLSGDIIIGGRTVKIAATDSLLSIRDKINAVNAGKDASRVTASIVHYGTNGYRLILTNEKEGATGIGLLNGGASDLIGLLGFVDASEKTAKNAISGGNRSDAFSAADKAVGGGDLLNLTSAQSGNVTITVNGTARSVAIDLAADSLHKIRDAINTAFTGVFTSDPASVVSETVDGTTKHRLIIEGNSLSYIDSNNVMETLGVLRRAGVSDERGMTGDVANTSGGVAITSSTLIKDIDGYNDYLPGDVIMLNGTSTTGAAVHDEFTITDASTVGDLLTAIESAYGEVKASVTADGKLRILDNEIGDDQLSILIVPDKTALRYDTDGNLGEISTIRARQIQAGLNAILSVDGVMVTSTDNTVDEVIPGVTLNLKKAAEDATLTLTVGRDLDGAKNKIKEFVSAFNDVLNAINAHMVYNPDTQKTGGALFGDSTLKAIKSNLMNLILGKVDGVSDPFSTLGLAGIRLGANGNLTINENKLQELLKTNFGDLRRLFAADWSSTNSDLNYVYHTADTRAGMYHIVITGVNPVSGYLSAPGDATGKGEYLTGISGNAKGLLVRYSGTRTGEAGTLRLTFGVAELLDRQLQHITDPLNGYVSNKKEAIQGIIENLEEDIETMETRLDRKMAELERQFIAMETALSRLQSQTSWLNGQIRSVYNGWL